MAVMNRNQTNNLELAAAMTAAATFQHVDERKIKFRCVCGKHVIEPFSQIGRKGYCRKCKRGIVVPRPDSHNVVAIRCECGFETTVGLIIKGLKACPRCGKPLGLPGTPRMIPSDVILPVLFYGGLFLTVIITAILLILALP